MKKVNFGSTGKQVPAIVMGCMRMKELTVKEAAKLVDAAMAEGVEFFLIMRIFTEGESAKSVLKRRRKKRK